jgi:redox-sensitive bicupin YhaK (pirin superfamily)
VPIASGLKSDRGALPIRARARVLNAQLKTGQTFEYLLRRSRLAYLASSRGSVDINGVRIHSRNGVAISDVGAITISAIHDADLVMVDVL